MCGRYLFNDHNSKKIQEIMEETKSKYEQLILDLVSWEEIYPSAYTVVMIHEKNRLTPTLMNWGYPKWDGKGIIINARLENIRNSEFFKDDFYKNRCAIATTGFYEWDKDKKKHFIKNPGTEVIYLAGIYRIVNGKHYYCILTKEATEKLKCIHGRMPVVMNEEQALKYCKYETR